MDFGHSVPLEAEESCAMCDLRLRGGLSSGVCLDEEFKEHNVENLSLEFVRQGWSDGLIYPFFLGIGGPAQVAVSCSLALCQEMQEVW